MLQFFPNSLYCSKKECKMVKNLAVCFYRFLLFLVDAYVGSLNSVLYLFFLKYCLAKKQETNCKQKQTLGNEINLDVVIQQILIIYLKT